MGQHVFCIFIYYRGHHRKGTAIYDADEDNLQQKLWFHWTKNVFLNTMESFEQENPYQLALFLPWKNISVNLFRAAPYMLVLVLHQDVLFHCWIVLLPNHLSLMYNAAILIFLYLQMCFGGGIAPYSWTGGFLQKTAWLLKPAKNIILANVFLCWIHQVNLLIPSQ